MQSKDYSSQKRLLKQVNFVRPRGTHDPTLSQRCRCNHTNRKSKNGRRVSLDVDTLRVKHRQLQPVNQHVKTETTQLYCEGKCRSCNRMRRQMRRSLLNYTISNKTCPANLNNCPRRVHDGYGQFAYRVRNARLELLRTDLGKSEEPDRSLL